MNTLHTPLLPAKAGIQLGNSLDPRLRTPRALPKGRGSERIGGGVRWFLGALCILFLTACGQSESEAQDRQNQPKQTAQRTSQNNAPIREAILGSEFSYPVTPLIKCNGVFEQGGLALCKTAPNAKLEISRSETDKFTAKADRNGNFLLGFDRDESFSAIKVVAGEIPKNMAKAPVKTTFTFAPREYAVSRIDGLPPSQVSTFSDKQLVRIRASSARKKKGFASRQQTMWFKDGFDYPLKTFKKTSPFGAQRILNGVKKKPHYGVDIAAPVGTPIYAPADGVVSMADENLYFEGAMVLIDHGQGLISMYLHMSAIDVKPGQEVKRGEKIGEVGSRGRSTGPHLCWRLKWRNRHLDPELLTKWPTEEHTHD